MVVGVILIVIGVLGIFVNTIALLTFYTRFKKENELSFITLRGFYEPKTLKMTSYKTNLSDFKEPDYFKNNNEEIRLQSKEKIARKSDDTDFIDV